MASVKSIKSIPGPVLLPLIGNLYQYKLGIYRVSDYHNVLSALYNKYGPIVRCQLGPPSSTIIHLFDPEHAETVHSKEGKLPFVKPLQPTVQHYRKIRKTSPGLGNTNGDEWYRLRSAVRKMMLVPVQVQSYLPLSNRITDEMVARIEKLTNRNGEIIKLREEISKWTREITGWMCFGKSLGSMDGGQGEAQAVKIIEANRAVFKNSAKLEFSLPFYRFMSTPTWNKIVAAEDILTGHGLDLVNEAITALSRGEREECDFLKYLLGREDLSDDDIGIICLSLFTDGLSTVVPTLMNCLYALATNPVAQEQVYAEACAAAENGEITVASLSKLPYLRAAIKETFRLYPNGIEIDRILQTDHEVGGYLLPKETNVTMNQIVHFRSPKYFEDPETFKPERWLRGETASAIHSYLILPFGTGARSCIGRRFAEQDLHVALCKILMKYRLFAPSKPPLQMEYETLLCPKEPIGVQFHKR